MNHLTAASYPQVRPSIRSGDLLAWRGTGPVGRLIRHWTGESWSHVGIAWAIGGRVMALEAREGRGVVATPLSRRLDCHHIPTGAEWDDAMQSRALERLGEHYSYMDAIRAGFGLRLAGSGWQCAEYAAYVLGLEGLPAFTPGEIVMSCQSRSRS